MTAFTDVRVTLRNFLRDTHQVSFRYGGVPIYEVFPSREEAEFWAEKIKTGEWDPLEDEPTKALRKQLENA